MAILEKKDILVNNAPMNKEDVIRKIGKMLVDGGHCTESYVDAMLEKEKMINTAIGNLVAIPHGVGSAKGQITDPGMAIMTFPDGTDWGDGNTVKLVIGIAAGGDEHMDVLSKIAMSCYDVAGTEKVVASPVDKIYDMFVL